MDETPRKVHRVDGAKGNERKKRKKRENSRSTERDRGRRRVSPVTSSRNQAGNTKPSNRKKSFTRTGSTYSVTGRSDHDNLTKDRKTSSPKPKHKIPPNRRKSIRLSSDSRIPVNKATTKSQAGRRKSIRLHSNTQIVVCKRSPSPDRSCGSISPDCSELESQPTSSRLNTKLVTKKHSPSSHNDNKRKLSTISSSSKSQPSSRVLSPASVGKHCIGSFDSSPASSRRGSFSSEKEHSLDLSLSFSLSQSTRLRSRRREVRLISYSDVQ